MLKIYGSSRDYKLRLNEIKSVEPNPSLSKVSLDKNMNISTRIATYGAMATELALLSDQRLLKLLETATPMGTSIGGTTLLLKIGGTSIFVKKIRITDIERFPQNIMSTANLFNLPEYYQYGLGSAGFGVWRELAVHTITTNWVLAAKCQSFPMMYHWRLLPRAVLEPTSEELKELAHDVEFWDGSAAVRTRLEVNLAASADIVLFLEYIPENIHQWFSKQIAKGGKASESACAMVESNLKTITSFINAHGLLHFDAHFYNILTDGHCLYFADFGLATCDQFELSEAELDFFKRHHNYDKCYAMAYFVEWLLAALFGKENYIIGSFNAVLQEYAAGKGRPLPPWIAAIVKRYLPIAVVMNEFFCKLKESKATLYPTSELERACAISGLL